MRTLWLKNRFLRVLGFSILFQLTSWFYIWSLVPHPLTHGDIVLLLFYIARPGLLTINEGNIFILHCGSHSVTLYAISTLLSPSLSL